MGQKIFMLGFADELTKLAQIGPRPAPGTRMPKPVPQKHMAPGPKKFAPPKPKGPVAEGIVPGTFQPRLPDLPSGKKMPKAQGIVSAVGERKAWEAKVKKEENKLPGWLSDSMKRPVKGNPMAKAEDVARSKREDTEASKLVSGFTKKKPGAVRRGMARRRKPAKKEGPWFLSKDRGTRLKGRKGFVPPVSTGQNITPASQIREQRALRKSLKPGGSRHLTAKDVARNLQSKSRSVPGWRAGIGQGITRPSRFFSGERVSPGGTVLSGPAAAQKRVQQAAQAAKKRTI